MHDATSTACAVRPTVAADVPSLKLVIAALDLFPADLLEGMSAPFLAGEADDELWLTAVSDAPVAVAYCKREAMTDGVWNMLLLAVAPGAQRQGIGARVVQAAEDAMCTLAARLLIVETSGMPVFEQARSFYRALDFVEEARIRDFYRVGEDKVIFRKSLAAGPAR